MPDIIGVTDRIEAAGVITFWRMAGNMDITALATAWAEEGFDSDDLPPLPSAAAALRRAVYEQRKNDILVRPLRRADFSGWAVVGEITGETLEHTPLVHVSVDDFGRLWFEEPGTDDAALNVQLAQQITDNIKAAYNRYLGLVTAADASSWLVKRVHAFAAIPLRDTGGFYFVPFPHSQRWERVAKIIRNATPHDVGLIPAMKTDEAVRTILVSLEEEANAEAARMFEDIANGELGERALSTRADRCSVLMRKVADYERLLGVQASALNTRLEELRTSLAAATLVATSDANATGILAL